MIFSNISYFFEKALESIRRNPFINLVTTGVITVSFLIFSSFLMLFNNLNNALELWEKDIQIEAYITEGATDERTDETMKSILSMAGIAGTTYIAKDEALTRFKSEMSGMGSIAEDLASNPLPASFEIRLKEGFRDVATIKRVAAKLMEIDIINDVVYGQEWIEKFATSLAVIRIIALTIGAFLLMATIFIVSNTIKLTVYTKKEELEISRLLGATNFFIKMPFYIEGLIQGLVGSALSILSLYAIYSFFVVNITSSFEAALVTGSFQVSFLSTQSILYILTGGMLLGLFGSFISIGRFLKV